MDELTVTLMRELIKINDNKPMGTTYLMDSASALLLIEQAMGRTEASQKIGLIRLLRALSGIGLKEAKEAVERLFNSEPETLTLADIFAQEMYKNKENRK